MHTFEGKRTFFHFNSDMSGDVRVIVRNEDKFKTFNEEINIPGQDILDFVAMYVSRHRIARYEARINAESTEETLGLTK